MRSVRLRLLVLALLPLVVLLPLLLGITMMRLINRYDELLIAKVASDLRVAQQYFGRIEATQAAEVAALAQSVRFDRAKAEGPEALAALLAREQVAMGLDFLIHGAAGGEAIPAAADVVDAATPEAPSAGLAVFDGRDLAAIAPELAERAAWCCWPPIARRAMAARWSAAGC